MKIRNGFVSNSSTCSFLLIGYKVKEPDDQKSDVFYEKYEKELKLDYEYIEGEKYNEYVVGKMLAWWNDNDAMDTMDISLDELFKIKEEIKQKMNRKDDPKLFGGTTCC